MTSVMWIFALLVCGGISQHNVPEQVACGSEGTNCAAVDSTGLDMDVNRMKFALLQTEMNLFTANINAGDVNDLEGSHEVDDLDDGIELADILPMPVQDPVEIEKAHPQSDGGVILTQAQDSGCPEQLDAAIIDPHCIHNYTHFVTELITRLQTRILWPSNALGHALSNLTTSQTAGAGKLWMEFGVFQGSSTKRIVDRLRELTHGAEGMLFGFDSFDGLPEAWLKGYEEKFGHYEPGSFNYSHAPFHDPQVSWVKGWFNESVPRFLNSVHSKSGEITFMHLDADLYSSTASVLHDLAPKIGPECIMVFDDLVNYPAYREGELKALWEFFSLTRRPLKVVGATGKHVMMYPSADANKPSGMESVALIVL